MFHERIFKQLAKICKEINQINKTASTSQNLHNPQDAKRNRNRPFLAVVLHTIDPPAEKYLCILSADVTKEPKKHQIFAKLKPRIALIIMFFMLEARHFIQRAVAKGDIHFSRHKLSKRLRVGLCSRIVRKKEKYVCFGHVKS